MKVFIHYEDHANEELHKTSKVTLPKKWLIGPVSAIVDLFISAYNPKNPANELTAASVHLENDKGQALAGECVVSEYLFPSVDVYVKHGPAPSMAAVTADRTDSAPAPAPAAAAMASAAAPSSKDASGLQLCKRFGCQKKFDPTHNHEAACNYHRCDTKAALRVWWQWWCGAVVFGLLRDAFV
jgi:hypothetical protein